MATALIPVVFFLLSPMKLPRPQLVLADCLTWLREQDDDSVDLVITSPPYEDARYYDELEFRLHGDAWVDWACERFIECVRVSAGLTAWVIQGRTRNFRWSATPALLMAKLHHEGIGLRLPPIYYRHGIPGSGGPDWWASKYEFIVCASKGKLPWSDNTAAGHPPKYGPGGAFTNRNAKGDRVNNNGCKTKVPYHPPKLSNPGNLLIDCGAVGGGNIGNKLAHENEAPFPEKLVEPFIKSFCPPNGVVLDPFMGSGTTLAVARRLGRRSIGVEIRESQIELSRRRLGLTGRKHGTKKTTPSGRS